MAEMTDWLESNSLTALTQRSYRTEVERFTAFLEVRRASLPELQSRHLKRFWAQLIDGRLHRSGRRPKAGSAQQSRRIVSAYLRWCVAHGFAPSDILSSLDEWEIPAGAPELKNRSAVSPMAPMALLLEAADLDNAAAALSFWSGASPQELATVQIAAFDWTLATFAVDRGSTTSSVTLPRSLADSLQRLGSEHKRYLFGDDHPSTAVSVARRIARWGNRCGAGAVSARSLRAQFLSLAQSAGWTTDEIRNQVRRVDLRLPMSPPPPPERLAVLERTVSGRA